MTNNDTVEAVATVDLPEDDIITNRYNMEKVVGIELGSIDSVNTTVLGRMSAVAGLPAMNSNVKMSKTVESAQ